jgi:hypothetical protein
VDIIEIADNSLVVGTHFARLDWSISYLYGRNIVYLQPSRSYPESFLALYKYNYDFNEVLGEP